MRQHKLAVKGDGKFTKDFSANKPKNSSGKSLYDFDFNKRISQVPCSWVIYSYSFEGLPNELKELVLQKLKSLLNSSELPDKFIHLRKYKAEIHTLLMETVEAYR